MAVLVLSLLGIGLIFVFGAVVSALTVTGARRRARRSAHHLGQLARWCSVNELAAIDEALDRVLAGDRGTIPGRSRR